LRSKRDATGRVVRIAKILGRVVVSIAHREKGSFWQENGLGGAGFSLPVEIPVLDEDEPLSGAIRQRGETLNFLPQVMQMRHHAEELHIDRQFERALNDINILAGRN